MKVCDFRLFLAKQRPQFLCAVESPNCLQADFNLVEDSALSDLAVVSRIFQDSVAREAQQFFFAVKDFVFSTLAAVTIVRQQHPHNKK